MYIDEKGLLDGIYLWQVRTVKVNLANKLLFHEQI